MSLRYHRQEILPQIGAEGQERIAAARVVLIGCGALGTVMAEMLARAGIGHLRIVDRDVVELTNLQRQTLFTESDAHDGLPKVVAAAQRLKQINSEIVIEPMVADVDSGNVEDLLRFPDSQLGTVRLGSPQAGNSQLLDSAPTLALPSSTSLTAGRSTRGGEMGHLILDGTDNIETRYLINDAAVKHNIPWVYAAAVGVEGRVMGIRPGKSACLRCMFAEPAAAGELATCDTAGVLAATSGLVASLAVVEGLKLLLGEPPTGLISADVWAGRFVKMDLGEKPDARCICCGKTDFEFLRRRPAEDGAKLCGRNAVQIRGNGAADLTSLSHKLEKSAEVKLTPYMLRAELRDPTGVTLSVFSDGRIIVAGTTDTGRARALVARFLGA